MSAGTLTVEDVSSLAASACPATGAASRTAGPSAGSARAAARSRATGSGIPAIAFSR
ncbi:MAG: hypothetical protein ABWY46_05300 [Pseudomonas sp.]